MARRTYKSETPVADPKLAALGWKTMVVEQKVGSRKDEGRNAKAPVAIPYDTFGNTPATVVEKDGKVTVMGSSILWLDYLTNVVRPAVLAGDKIVVGQLDADYDLWVYGKDLEARSQSSAKAATVDPIIQISEKQSVNLETGVVLDKKTELPVPGAKDWTMAERIEALNEAIAYHNRRGAKLTGAYQSGLDKLVAANAVEVVGGKVVAKKNGAVKK